jgi:hypothetical protein
LEEKCEFMKESHSLYEKRLDKSPMRPIDELQTGINKQRSVTFAGDKHRGVPTGSVKRGKSVHDKDVDEHYLLN